MTDLGPMPPCIAGRNGKHELSAIIPDDDGREMTLFCSHCGAIRRLPVTGSPYAARLDDETADAIAEHVRRGSW